MNNRFRWAQRHALLLILLLGLILRLIGLESRSLQYDDTFSIFLSARSLPEILSGTAADTMPPLYYFLLHFWMLLGQSAWFIRLLSVILSLVALFVGIWAIFLKTVTYGAQPQQSPVMFFPLPAFLLLTLYWVRWWAIEPPAVWYDLLDGR